MKFFNTLSAKLEEFVPQNEGIITMYGCGTTVYNYMHVGNARMAVTFDALRRWFELSGYKVTYVQNFTDIDDKIIRRAEEEGITWREVSDKYIAEYYVDAHALGVRDASVAPLATDHIPEIISLTQKLIAKGLAYESGGDVYYRTGNFADYGKLSHQPLDNLLAGARIEPGEVKENAADFVLWKAAKPGEPFWQSPWGKGRPGWHIECSAMSTKYLGETFDIHVGGSDLIFPHHENEIAQSEGASGKTFARFWLHNGMITIDRRKMSKSLGNFFTVRDAAASYSYDVLRYYILSSHYRGPLDYSEETLNAAAASLTRLKTARENMLFIEKSGKAELTEAETEYTGKLEKYDRRFTEALNLDFNTADALGIMFEFVRETNTILAASSASSPCAAAALRAMDKMNEVFGFNLASSVPESDAEIEALIAERTAAKDRKDWARADEIRSQLSEMGVTLEDTKQGVKYTRK